MTILNLYIDTTLLPSSSVWTGGYEIHTVSFRHNIYLMASGISDLQSNSRLSLHNSSSQSGTAPLDPSTQIQDIRLLERYATFQNRDRQCIFSDVFLDVFHLTMFFAIQTVHDISRNIANCVNSFRQLRRHNLVSRLYSFIKSSKLHAPDATCLRVCRLVICFWKTDEFVHDSA